jgi:predicted Zn-dependent peptidase
LGDILQNSTFLDEELVREKGVIIQEIAMHNDTPDDMIVDYFDDRAFPHQPLGRSILSDEKHINAYTRDDLIRYMDTHYRPERMVLSAAGNVQHETFVKMAEEYFTMPAKPIGPTFEIANYVGGDIRVESDHEQMHLMFGLPAISMHSPDYYVLQLYASILGGGMSSRLFQEVREKRGLAYTVYAMGSAYEDCGVLSLYAATSPDKSGELSGVLAEQLNAMGSHIGANELHRAKNQHKADLLMARENPQSVATWIGRHLLMYKEYRNAKEISARIDTITCDDVLKLSQKIASGKLTVAALGEIDGVRPYGELQKKLSG